MTDAVAELLDRLWTHGVFRGSSHDLALVAVQCYDHQRATELRAWADLSVLLERELERLRPPGVYLVDESEPAVARALAFAASVWRGAAISDTTRADIALGRARSALAEDGALADARRPAADGYLDLALAELHVTRGEQAEARRVLQRAATRERTPPACALAARGRLALLLGALDPKLAVRTLDSVAAQAERLGQPEEVLHARTYAGLQALLGGQIETGRRRLEAVAATEPPPGARRYVSLARLLLASIAGERDGDADAADAHLAEGIRLAAADGDHWGYTVLVGTAARAYAERGRHVDALVTVTAGIEQMRRAGGEELALPLTAEREALRHELGDEAFERAVAAALAEL